DADERHEAVPARHRRPTLAARAPGARPLSERAWHAWRSAWPSRTGLACLAHGRAARRGYGRPGHLRAVPAALELPAVHAAPAHRGGHGARARGRHGGPAGAVALARGL